VAKDYFRYVIVTGFSPKRPLPKCESPRLLSNSGG
jgi:hypothetical protein